MLTGVAQPTTDATAGAPEPVVSLWEGLRGLSFALDLAMGRHGHGQVVAAFLPAA